MNLLDTPLRPRRSTARLLVPIAACAAVAGIVLSGIAIAGADEKAAASATVAISGGSPTAGSPTDEGTPGSEESPTGESYPTNESYPTSEESPTGESYPTDTTGPGTEIITVNLYDALGHVAVPVQWRGVGHCSPGGPYTTRPDAFGCEAETATGEHRSLSQCLASPNPHLREIACLSMPWNEVSVVQLTASLPARPQPSRTAGVWAFELEDGTKCWQVDGGRVIAGVMMGYSCDSAWTSEPVEGATWWTVQQGGSGYNPDPNGPVTTLKVTKIWY